MNGSAKFNINSSMKIKSNFSAFVRCFLPHAATRNLFLSQMNHLTNKGIQRNPFSLNVNDTCLQVHTSTGPER